MFMCVKLNTLYDREIKSYYVIQVLKQGTNILEFRNKKSHLLQVYLGTWVKKEIENHVF